ncbi:hypothetical protein RYA05_04370 [Pseudomonas syringae pv. actinidiae]|nr:hypothetical protein [Pseudomonas syringae pv. actinidiae]
MQRASLGLTLPMPLECRPLKVIIDEHSLSVSPLMGVPGYAVDTLQGLSGVELASDFIICESSNQEDYQELLGSVSSGDHHHWVVFAASGQGDLWLLSKTDNLVGYYDHNHEGLKRDAISKTGIRLEVWVVLADLIRQLEARMELRQLTTEDESEVVMALSSLGVCLHELPFSYF